MIDNVAAGCAGLGIVYYPSDLKKRGLALETIPRAECRGNAIYASRRGLGVYGSVAGPDPHRVEGLTVWGLRYGAFEVAYSGHFEVTGRRFVGGVGEDAVYIDEESRHVFREYYVGTDSAGFRRVAFRYVQ